LYYVDSKGTDDERRLVISEDDRPIEPKANDPDEVTTPGFYLSHENRLDFEEIEVTGDRIYFRTVSADGVIYEFRGTTGGVIDSDFSVPIPFIKGRLRTMKRGNVIRIENIKFGHAVIL
jgi:hypothetical protein